MKIDELISELEQVKEEHGNLEVRNIETTSARQEDIVHTNNILIILKDGWQLPELNY